MSWQKVTLFAVLLAGVAVLTYLGAGDLAREVIDAAQGLFQ